MPHGRRENVEYANEKEVQVSHRIDFEIRRVCDVLWMSSREIDVRLRRLLGDEFQGKYDVLLRQPYGVWRWRLFLLQIQRLLDDYTRSSLKSHSKCLLAYFSCLYYYLKLSPIAIKFLGLPLKINDQCHVTLSPLWIYSMYIKSSDNWQGQYFSELWPILDLFWYSQPIFGK